MANPPRSPTTLTTSRNRALDVGADRSNFVDSPPFDAAAGTPVGWPGSGGTFQCNVARDGQPATTADAPPPNPKPFQ